MRNSWNFRRYFHLQTVWENNCSYFEEGRNSKVDMKGFWHNLNKFDYKILWGMFRTMFMPDHLKFCSHFHSIWSYCHFNTHNSASLIPNGRIIKYKCHFSEKTTMMMCGLPLIYLSIFTSTCFYNMFFQFRHQSKLCMCDKSEPSTDRHHFRKK